MESCRAPTFLAELEDDDEMPEPDEDENDDDDNEDDDYEEVLVSMLFSHNFSVQLLKSHVITCLSCVCSPRTMRLPTKAGTAAL